MVWRPRFIDLAAVAALFLVAATLAGCGDDDKKVDPRVPPAGSSAGFKEGYLKGCAIGVEDADHPGARLLAPESPGAKQAAERYAKDIEFKNGWDKGYFACYDDENS